MKTRHRPKPCVSARGRLSFARTVCYDAERVAFAVSGQAPPPEHTIISARQSAMQGQRRRSTQACKMRRKKEKAKAQRRKALRRGVRRREGESSLFHVHCASPDGEPRKHRVRLAADGHIMFLDHERGELHRSLHHFKLAGTTPSGCYAALLKWQVNLAGRFQPVACALIEQHVTAAGAARALRTFLRGGTARFTREWHRRGKPIWLISRASTLDLSAAPASLGVLRLPAILRVAYAGGVVHWGGFVAVRNKAGPTLVWDVTVPGIQQLVAPGTSGDLPGVLALRRISRQVLAGWRGLVQVTRTEPTSCSLRA